MHKKILMVLAVVLGIGAVVLAYDTTKYFRVENGNRLFTAEVAILGAASVEGATTLADVTTSNVTVSDTATISTATVARAVATSLAVGTGGDLLFIGSGSGAVLYQTGTITISGLLPGGDYNVGLSWADSTNDPGKTTWAITTDTLTVTCATATSGTVHAIVIGR